MAIMRHLHSTLLMMWSCQLCLSFSFCVMLVCCEFVGGGIDICLLWICCELIMLLGMMVPLLLVASSVCWCFEIDLQFCQLWCSVGLVRVDLLLHHHLGVLLSKSRMIWFCLFCWLGRSALRHRIPGLVWCLCRGCCISCDCFLFVLVPSCCLQI